MSVIFMLDTRLVAPRTERLEPLLPRQRLEKMRAYRFEADRLRSLAAGLLIAGVFGERPLRHGPHGKPYVEGGPNFNLSHSGHFVLMAVDRLPVGIDIEMHRDNDFAAIAEVAFHPEEHEAWRRSGSERYFYDLWTLKESYLKMLGRGMSLDPRSFSLRLAECGCQPGEGVPGNCRFRIYDACEGYSVGLCAMGDAWPDAVRAVHPDRLEELAVFDGSHF